ncbi:hypothetical protein POTOM_010164 [Populus tomentosa]|uniref:Uncharacterized protein n=1 Tax=Populus tomentosa TaxID=118781 RepID=A0A8X8A7M4_POPTO|nr:hypothetical protein POTOM_010164 [Populus tomentosa]
MVLTNFSGRGVGFDVGDAWIRLVKCGWDSILVQPNQSRYFNPAQWSMPVNILGLGAGAGCGVGLGLGWGFGTAFGSQYRSSTVTFQGMELAKKEESDDNHNGLPPLIMHAAMEAGLQDASEVLLNACWQRILSGLILGTIACAGKGKSNSDSSENYLEDRVSFSEDKIMDWNSLAMMMA